MENFQSLAIESFSYSWSRDKKQPPLDVSNPIDDVFNDNEVRNFNFDVPICDKSPVSIVHADDLFSDGYIKPALLLNDNQSHIEYVLSYSPFLSRSRTQPSTSPPPSPFFPVSPTSENKITSETKFLKKWKKSSTKIFQKCSGFLRPICKGLSFPRKSNRVDDLGRKVWEVERWGASLQTPPRWSVAHSAIDFTEMEEERRKSTQSYSMQRSPFSPGPKNYYDVDSDSIREAILHCKRSFEK